MAATPCKVKIAETKQAQTSTGFEGACLGPYEPDIGTSHQLQLFSSACQVVALRYRSTAIRWRLPGRKVTRSTQCHHRRPHRHLLQQVDPQHQTKLRVLQRTSAGALSSKQSGLRHACTPPRRPPQVMTATPSAAIKQLKHHLNTNSCMYTLGARPLLRYAAAPVRHHCEGHPASHCGPLSQTWTVTCERPLQTCPTQGLAAVPSWRGLCRNHQATRPPFMWNTRLGPSWHSKLASQHLLDVPKPRV